MKFDPKTGKLILPGKIEKNVENVQSVDVVDSEKDDSTLPTCEFDCPKCDSKLAYYWIVQTRASDEPETKFLKCVKCRYTTRDYS
ncbi:MAG: RPA12/RPB9/RPC11 RNA polymerase family protein [Candidatus Woesearchaeota archaeon]